MKSKAVKTLWSYLSIVGASLIYAVGFNWCYVPNDIAFGGITGVGQIVNFLLPWAPIGTVVIVLNIPLFLLGWRLLGGHLLISSLFAMAVSSVFIDLIDSLYQFPPMDPLLACIFGGVLLGLSLGLVFQQGATTGGTDLLARLIKLKLSVDTHYSSVMDYFEIFMQRMILCRKAAERLGLQFKLMINEQQLI